MVSHTPAKCGGHRHGGSRDIMVLVCPVISQDYVTKRSSNIMGRSPSMLVTMMPSLVVIGTLVVKIRF